MKRKIRDKILSKFKALSIYKNPLLYIFDFFNLGRSAKIVYELKNGLRFKVRNHTCDRGIIDEIFVHKIYSPAGFEIKEDDIVLDVGAHVGIFSIYASAQAAKGQVYAFEPFPESFDMFEENIELNCRENIRAIPAALSGETGIKNLYLSKDSVCHSLNGGEGRKKIEVKADTLSEFMAVEKLEKIDYLKMDCEGGEYDIFFKAPDSVFAKISKIGMEYHNLNAENNVDKLKAFLESKGFTVTIGQGIFPMLYAVKK